MEKLDTFINSIRQEYEKNLKIFVDIPSVSADPEHKNDIERMAQAAADLLKRFGAKSEIIKTAGNPVVIGKYFRDSKFPTLTIYNHLDVQPANPDEWQTPPFSLTINSGFYKGRGATDDKGPALTALYAAKYAYEQALPLNVTFIWELEEEIGSPHFSAFLKSQKNKLETDSILVSDTIWLSKDKPSMSYGLRGLCGALLKLKTGGKDVHSGTTGGLARNPIGELCKLLSECYDASTGEIKIPGFYDDILPVSDEEMKYMEECDFPLSHFKKAHELLSLRTNDPLDGLKRIWIKPTFEIHGIVGGYIGPGVKTIVPHQAEAKVSMRLVPGQKPEKIFQLLSKFIKDRNPDVEVLPEGYLGPYLGHQADNYHQAAKNAFKNIFGRDPILAREGGSIGAVISMHDILQVPIVFIGLSLPEHGYHAINEYFDWQQVQNGIKLFTEYFKELVSL